MARRQQGEGSRLWTARLDRTSNPIEVADAYFLVLSSESDSRAQISRRYQYEYLYERGLPFNSASVTGARTGF
jgi:hypothetical protein